MSLAPEPADLPALPDLPDLPDLPVLPLSQAARDQLEATGVSYAELYRVVTQPAVRMPIPAGDGERLNGYGLSVVIEEEQITEVSIDGASALTWRAWARERAEFGDGDVAGADQLVAARLRESVLPRQGLRRKKDVEEPPIRTAHILDRIAPALREIVTRQVDGDYSRLVIHSRTRVEVLPKREVDLRKQIWQ